MSDNSSCTHVWLGNDEHSIENMISLYPNPAFNKLKVKGDLKNFTSTTVCGIDGQEMPTTVIYRNDESLTLDLRLLAKGIYFLQIQIGEYLVTEKVIKE